MAAAAGPDENVAAALEEAASEAIARGGVSAEAKALEHAARLTPASEPRARRLLRAGFAAEAAGSLEHAEELLAEAADLTESPALRDDAVARDLRRARRQVQGRSGVGCARIRCADT
jgi:tetratricopeptide (TPR) repeat protein